jgi:hypothetical protein
VAQPAESPIIAHIGAATMIHLLFDGKRRPFGQRASLVMVAKVDQPDEDADGGVGAAPPAPELPAADGIDGLLILRLRESMETTPTVRWEYTEPRESR